MPEVKWESGSVANGERRHDCLRQWIIKSETKETGMSCIKICNSCSLLGIMNGGNSPERVHELSRLFSFVCRAVFPFPDRISRATLKG